MCMFVWACTGVDVLRCIVPHSVHGCILNWISSLALMCTRQRRGALKTYFNMESDLKKNVKVGKSKPFHFSGSFICWSTGKD